MADFISRLVKCPHCGNDMSLTDGIAVCCRCNRSYASVGGGLLKVRVVSSEDGSDIGISPVASRSSDSEIMLAVDSQRAESDAESRSWKIGEEIRRAGYGQTNPVPVYKPLRIGSSWYVFGYCAGIRLSPRGETSYGCDGDRHVMWELLAEDDGFWSLNESPMSSGWLDDLNRVLCCARSFLERQECERTDSGAPCGWRFAK